MKNKYSKFVPLLRAVALLFLAVICHSGSGQTDTNLVATGDWSKAVTDRDGYTLRGRLLVYNDEDPSAANHARIYLELQHVFTGAWNNPVQLYYDFGIGSPMHFEMRNRMGHPIAQENVLEDCLLPIEGWWVVLPCDATVRWRADVLGCGKQTKPNGLEIFVNNGDWLMKPDSTNDFFLSATFTATTNHPSPLNCHIWQGTVELPAVRIPAGSQ